MAEEFDYNIQLSQAQMSSKKKNKKLKIEKINE